MLIDSLSLSFSLSLSLSLSCRQDATTYVVHCIMYIYSYVTKLSELDQ